MSFSLNLRSGKVQPKLTNITKVSSLLKAAHSSAILNSTSIDQSNDSYNGNYTYIIKKKQKNFKIFH